MAPVYILAGTAMPMRSSARVSCARTYAMPAARQARTSRPLLVQNRRLVIEAIERLREAERVLGQHRELQRAHDLLDDLVEPGRIEHQAPQLVAFRACQRLGGSVSTAARTAASSRPVRSCSFGEDVVGANHGVLQIRAAFAFEAERLVDVERDDLAARVLDHEVPHRGDRNLSPVRATSSAHSSGLRLATSAVAVRSSRSMRSSALTPSPLRPDTSTNGFLSSSAGGAYPSIARGGVRERHHLVREMDGAFRLPWCGPWPRAPASGASAGTTGARR